MQYSVPTIHSSSKMQSDHPSILFGFSLPPVEMISIFPSLLDQTKNFAKVYNLPRHKILPEIFNYAVCNFCAASKMVPSTN